LYETFIDSSAHLGKLFVAVVNSELSDKMMSYNRSESVTKNLYSFGGSYVAVEREYRDFSVPVAPSGGTVYLIIKQFEEIEVYVINVQRDVESIVLHLYEVCDLQGHHVENVLV
jgi:hypothetical protein